MQRCLACEADSRRHGSAAVWPWRRGACVYACSSANKWDLWDTWDLYAPGPISPMSRIGPVQEQRCARNSNADMRSRPPRHGRSGLKSILEFDSKELWKSSLLLSRGCHP